MARSSGRRDHIVRTKVATGKFTDPVTTADGVRPVEHYEYTSWCGEKRMGYERSEPYGFITYASVQSCTKCRSKYAAAELKNNPIQFRLGERVDASDEANIYGVTRWSFKSCYPVIDTTILAEEERDKVVGFITIDNGWGKQWEIHPWERTTRSSMEAPSEPKVSAGGVISYDKAYSSDPEAKMYPHDCKRLPSKEDALMMFPLLSEQGKLTTRQAILKKDQEWLDEAKRRDEERERESIARHERRLAEAAVKQSEREALLTDIREALNDATLSNFNRDVMFRVAREAGFSEAELSGPLAVASVPATAGPLTDEWGEVIG